jgi:hypothetical protein
MGLVSPPTTRDRRLVRKFLRLRGEEVLLIDFIPAAKWRQLPADFTGLADGARLFQALAHRRLLDRPAPCALPTRPRRSRPRNAP